MKYVQPINNPSNAENYQKFLLNSTVESSVTVRLFNSSYSGLYGDSCAGFPCEAEAGTDEFSYQFNVQFPNYAVLNKTDDG
jgi:hypothetical protein